MFKDVTARPTTVSASHRSAGSVRDGACMARVVTFPVGVPHSRGSIGAAKPRVHTRCRRPLGGRRDGRTSAAGCDSCARPGERTPRAPNSPYRVRPSHSSRIAADLSLVWRLSEVAGAAANRRDSNGDGLAVDLRSAARSCKLRTRRCTSRVVRHTRWPLRWAATPRSRSSCAWRTDRQLAAHWPWTALTRV